MKFRNFFKKKKKDTDNKEIVNSIELLKMSINSIESTLNTLVCQVNYLASNIDHLTSSINQITESNESFRHQLQIEEALRNQETDIRLLKTKIEKTIDILQNQNV